MSLFGGGGGSSGGGGTTTTTSTPDPTQQELNRLLSGQITELIGATGGMSRLGQPQPLIAELSPGEEIARGDISRFLRQGSGISPVELIGGPSTLVNPAEQIGFASLLSAADPTSRLAASRAYLEDVAGPMLIGQTAQAGLGRRSGAVTEALARGGSELTLPILQDVARAQGQLGITGLSYGPQLESRAFDRLATLADVEGIPRTLQVQDFMRQQGLLGSLLTGAPFVGGQTTTSQQRTQARDVNWLTDVLVPLGAAAMFGMCWVAESLYGPYAIQTALARLAIQRWCGPWASLGRGLYRVVGRPLAWAVRRWPRLQDWLRPCFDRAVQDGLRRAMA